MNNNYYLRSAIVSDLDRCFEIESIAYAGDEAATKEKILKRITLYPEGFLVIENDQEIMGFVNSGAAHQVTLSDESFKELVGHDSTGKHIVIMSVVVHPDYQSKGISKMLMNAFVDAMRGLGKETIYLICQKELISMYAQYGFIDLGESSSSHGGLLWHEMMLSL